MELTRRILHLKSKPVQFIYPIQNKQLEQDLFEFMCQKKAIGLSAPQVGIRSRVFVMRIYDIKWACFNPVILKTSDNLVEFNEGCLSFQGDQCIIKRPDEIYVRYQDFQGQVNESHMYGLTARCFQHEMDHLDGITMWDRHKEQNAEQS